MPSYHCGWVLEGPYREDKRPMAVFFGRSFGPFVMLADLFWMPWASKRNKCECAVKFLQEMRRKYLMILTSTKSDTPFYEYIAKHGVIRRVGTIQGLYENEDAALFQTRVIHEPHN